MKDDENKKTSGAKKRGRPANTAPEPVIEDFHPQTPKEVTTAEALLMEMDRMVDAQDVLLNSGAINAASFLKCVAEKVMMESYIKIKDGKKYKDLQFVDKDGNRRHFADFEEYCKVVHKKSARRMRQLEANYYTIGPDLFEQAQEIGLLERHYSAIRALPEEDKAIIKEAIAKESKDEVIEILEDTIAKRREEQQAAAEEKEKLLQAAEATDKMLQDKNQKIDDLTKQVKKDEAEFTWHAESIDLAAEMGGVTTVLDHWVTKLGELLIKTELICHHIDEDEKRSVAIHYHEAVEHAAARVAHLQYETAASLDKYIGIADRYRLAPPETDENGVVIDAADDDPLH